MKMKLIYSTLLVLLSLPVVALQKFDIRIDTPSPCKRLIISEIYEANSRMLISAYVIHEAEGMVCSQNISSTSASAMLNVDNIDNVDVAIIGKDWCWENPSTADNYFYLHYANELHSLIGDKTLIFSQKIPNTLNIKGFNGDKNCR